MTVEGAPDSTPVCVKCTVSQCQPAFSSHFLYSLESSLSTNDGHGDVNGNPNEYRAEFLAETPHVGIDVADDRGEDLEETPEDPNGPRPSWLRRVMPGSRFFYYMDQVFEIYTPVDGFKAMTMNAYTLVMQQLVYGLTQYKVPYPEPVSPACAQPVAIGAADGMEGQQGDKQQGVYLAAAVAAAAGGVQLASNGRMGVAAAALAGAVATAGLAAKKEVNAAAAAAAAAAAVQLLEMNNDVYKAANTAARAADSALTSKVMLADAVAAALQALQQYHKKTGDEVESVMSTTESVKAAAAAAAAVASVAAYGPVTPEAALAAAAAVVGLGQQAQGNQPQGVDRARAMLKAMRVLERAAAPAATAAAAAVSLLLETSDMNFMYEEVGQSVSGQTAGIAARAAEQEFKIRWSDLTAGKDASGGDIFRDAALPDAAGATRRGAAAALAVQLGMDPVSALRAVEEADRDAGSTSVAAAAAAAGRVMLEGGLQVSTAAAVAAGAGAALAVRPARNLTAAVAAAAAVNAATRAFPGLYSAATIASTAAAAAEAATAMISSAKEGAGAAAVAVAAAADKAVDAARAVGGTSKELAAAVGTAAAAAAAAAMSKQAEALARTKQLACLVGTSQSIVSVAAAAAVLLVLHRPNTTPADAAVAAAAAAPVACWELCQGNGTSTATAASRAAAAAASALQTKGHEDMAAMTGAAAALLLRPGLSSAVAVAAAAAANALLLQPVSTTWKCAGPVLYTAPPPRVDAAAAAAAVAALSINAGWSSRAAAVAAADAAALVTKSTVAAAAADAAAAAAELVLRRKVAAVTSAAAALAERQEQEAPEAAVAAAVAGIVRTQPTALPGAVGMAAASVVLPSAIERKKTKFASEDALRDTLKAVAVSAKGAAAAAAAAALATHDNTTLAETASFAASAAGARDMAADAGSAEATAAAAAAAAIATQRGATPDEMKVAAATAVMAVRQMKSPAVSANAAAAAAAAFWGGARATGYHRTARRRAMQGCKSSRTVNRVTLFLARFLYGIGPLLGLLLTLLFQIGLPVLLLVNFESDMVDNCSVKDLRLQVAMGFVATYILLWVLFKDGSVMYNMQLNCMRLWDRRPGVHGKLRCDGKYPYYADRKRDIMLRRTAAVLLTGLCLIYAGVMVLVLETSFQVLVRSTTIDEVILSGVGALFILEIDDLVITVPKDRYKKWGERTDELTQAGGKILWNWPCLWYVTFILLFLLACFWCYGDFLACIVP